MERLRKIISSAKERGKRVSESLNSEYLSICFDYNYLDLKQRALKVYINTFYEKAENSKSLIFLHVLAGGTTSAEKYNFNLVAEFVKKEFRIKYSDTDSLYLTYSNRYYEKCDETFSRKELSNKVYWAEMVKITIDMMKKLRDQINAYFRIKSMTSYLKMTYEKVLFSICFTGKKKYFRIGHEEVVNFKLKKLFMKGIDTIK